MSATQTLKSLAILSDCTDREIGLLAQRMTKVALPAGEKLLVEGEAAQAAFVLEEGRLRITSRGEIVAVIDFVASFGEISCLLPDMPVSATAVAEKDSTLYRIAKADLIEVFSEVPKLWQALFRQSSDRLMRASKRLSEVLEHSPQGFLKLDRNACITNEYSKKAVDLLSQERPLPGLCLPEILMPGDAQARHSWQSVFSMVFDDVGVPLSDLFYLLPPEVRVQAHGVTRDLTFEFHPIYEGRQVVAVDVGIQDVTRQRELERAGEMEVQRQRTLGKIYQNPDSFFGLLRLIDEVENAGARVLGAIREQGAEPLRNEIAALMRDLHSLKGFAGSFGLGELQRKAHALETALQSGNAQTAFDDLRQAAGEGRAVKAMIDPSLLRRLEGTVLLPSQLEALRAALDSANNAEAKRILLAAEAVDSKQLFACWPAHIERLCTHFKKSARLEVYGVGGLVPKPTFLALDRVLIHVLNNLMDHGIEDPEARLCTDKDPEGLITVMVEVSDDRLLVDISDDGAGADFEAICRKALDNPKLDAAEVVRCEKAGEPWRVLIMPGFSTALELTDYSGRGVGLDAVASAVYALGGEVHIHSEPGQGFTFRLQIPLAQPVAGAS